MVIPAQNLWRWPRTLPGIALIFGLIFGLMAVALSCGGSAEYAESAAAPAPGVGQSDTASDISPELLAQQLGASGGGRIELGPAGPADPAGPAGPAGPQGGAGQDGAAAARPTPAPEIVVETARAASEAGQPASTAPRRGVATDDGASDSASSSSLSAQTHPQTGRQLIVEAWISLQVDAIDSLARQVEALAAQRGGWVESADILGEGGYRSAAIHIRVPAERFNNAMEALRALGVVTDEGISSADVTDRLIDNEARMTAWRAQEERLIALLENAATVEDIVDIEKRISEVRADIEQVAATQRDLQNRVAASLIRVNLHLPPRFASDPPTGQMTLAVGDPPAAGDAIIARVRARNGYIGQKREYRQGQGDAVELTAFVKSTDLAALMDYAATLGEIADRRLDSVGPSPDSDAPNARLSLVIHSNVDSAATLSLSAVDAIAVAGQIRAYAEARGGYVETWAEVRQGDSDIVNLEMVVKAADLRTVMDYGATLGHTENWEYQAAGQNPDDAVPNARLRLSVYTGGTGLNDLELGLTIGGVAIVILGIAAAAVVALLLRRRAAGRRTAGRSDTDAGAGAGGISARRQPLVPDAAGGDADGNGNERP